MLKSIFLYLLVFASGLPILLQTNSAAAQKVSRSDTLTIATSAQCGMCKERIEKAMAFEKGVKSSSLDLNSKELTVIYKSNRTSPEKLRKALSEVGYDADRVPANPKAYAKLPPCCKKPTDPDYQPH
jgi:mercuric ion binding protein